MVFVKYLSSSAQETREIGRILARQIQGQLRAAICLSGEIGSGKTMFSKGFVSELVEISEHAVDSPTFNYLNIYQGTCTLYHFDCYRLRDGFDFLSLGFDECLEGLCLIEWPEKIQDILPKKRDLITIEWVGKEERMIVYERH